MKRLTTLAVGVLAAGTLAACSGNTTSTTSSASPSASADTTGTAAAAAGSHNTADVMFVQMMIPHHEQAVEMATLAATRAGTPAVEQLAQQIRAAQGPEIAEMTGWLREWGEPTAMPHAEHHMGGMSGSATSMPGMMSDSSMTRLRTLSGTAFDRAFLTDMIVHHQGAIRMAEQIQRNGRDAQVRQLARNIASSQAAEITTMRRMLQQP